MTYANDRQLCWGPGLRSEAEFVSWQLWEAGAVAIEERDCENDLVELVAGFDDPVAVEVAATAIPGCRVEVVLDDGRSTWKQFAEPYTVDRLVVVPAWRPSPEYHDKIVVSIDPMDAFGLEHITTRTCIELIQPLIDVGARVLDVGCGSGILSVVAAKLGAQRVVAIDIDQRAIAATAHNAKRNGVGDAVVALDQPLHEVAEQFEVVIANLGGSEIMLRLQPELVACVQRGGVLCLGGMLAEAVQPVVDAFEWAEPPQVIAREGWAFIVGRPNRSVDLTNPITR